MTQLLTPIERVVSALRRLPGIGEKTATRLAYFLLAAPDPVASDLAEAIVRLRSDVVICRVRAAPMRTGRAARFA